MEMSDMKPNLIDIRSMKFMFKKSKVGRKSTVNENNDLQEKVCKAAAPILNTPHVFKPCRFISSLNSSKREFGSETELESHNSPNSESTEPCRKGQGQKLRTISFSFKELPTFQMTKSPTASRFKESDTKIRRLRLNIELKRSDQDQQSRKSLNTNLRDVNESLLNEFVKSKCLHATNKPRKAFNTPKA